MKYELAEGERELLKELVTGVRDGKQVPLSRLIVTNRRLVLLVPKPDGFSKLLGRLVGSPAAKMAAKLELVHQIRRKDFADVEAGDAGMLVFHSKGEGYAHVSFEVYGASSLELWQQRTRDWAAGDFDALERAAAGVA